MNKTKIVKMKRIVQLNNKLLQMNKKVLYIQRKFKWTKNKYVKKILLFYKNFVNENMIY